MPAHTFLPRADQAIVPPAKLRDYALNPDHQGGGRDKARVFGSALGIYRDDWEFLAEQLLVRVPRYPVSGIKLNPHGASYEVVINVDGRNGKTQPVLSAWFVEAHSIDIPPRLSSAYVYLP